jgi:hypothetical protein
MVQQDIKSGAFEDRLRSIELRLANLESAQALNNLNQPAVEAKELQTYESSSLAEPTIDEEKGLESRIGRVGLAWLGNFVLLFAIVFFTEYIITLGHGLLSVVIGVFAIGVIFLISNYLKKTNSSLSFMLKINGQVILFYEAFRMHFFSANPLIPNKFIIIVILLLIIAFQIYSALRNKSQTLGFLSVVFALFTAIMSDTTHIMLPLITLTAIGTVYYFFKYDWQFLLIAAIILVYVSFFMWLFGNPIMDHTMQILNSHKYGHLYLFALGGCFSLLPLLRKFDGSNDDFLIGAIILNGIFFTLLLTLISTKFFSKSYVSVFSIITICCLIYSVVLKSASDWKFASAFYALYGFLAMSISLYGMVGLPKVYLLLSVQSLIVVSMALWFRNRLIIVMNCLLFISILLVYMFLSKPVDGVNFSFALVPLISARIINWQKARLNIKTDFMRNLYLIEGFFMVLYALYHGLPGQFVTLSWTVAALLYFLLSFLLKNIKYRYMALGTMICATIYLFIVDLASIEIIYRVLALLFLAIVSIGISVYYTNRVNRSTH